MHINEGSYSYKVVLRDWICEAELYSCSDNIANCIEEVLDCSFIEREKISTITINNYEDRDIYNHGQS